MGASGLVYSAYLFWSQTLIDEEELEISNPFELGPAIKFGLVFALVLVISKAAEVYLGETGLYLSSFLAGLADVDAITLSIADLSQSSASITNITAVRAITLAAIANTLAKGVMVFSLGSKRLRKVVWPGFAVMLLIGLGFVLFY
jgi:uncharacterized membrane protein (DUF4010 family)